MYMNKIQKPLEPRRLITTDTDLIVLDGVVGGGKGLLAPIVSSFNGVNSWSARAELEQILYLHTSRNITTMACRELIKTWVDQYSINYVLGRDVNIKFSDMSGVWKQGKGLEFLRNMISNKTTDQAVQKISEKKPRVLLMTHAITSHAKPIFEAFGDRLTFLRITRHPSSIYMLQHLLRWLEKWRDTPSHGLLNLAREHSRVFKHPDVALSAECLSFKSGIDEVIQLLWEWQVSGDSAIDESKVSAEGQILEVCYEKFVFEPMPVIKTLSSLIREPISGSVLKELKRQGVPRRSLTDAPHSAVYKRLGWSKPNSHRSMHDEFEEGLAWAKSQGASKEFLDKLHELAVRYGNRHGLT